MYGSVYRNYTFFIKGYREFGKNGFQSAAKHFDPKALDEDISNRSYMITGANSGIGKSAATELAKKGATIHMVCRSQQRGEDAMQEIMSKTGNQNIKLHILDMSSPRKVHDFATSFSGDGNSLDVLINNAGCMINTREVQEDNLEKNFATNTMSTYVLTKSLIPTLSKSSSPRVITVASGGAYTMKLDYKDFNFEKMSKFDGTFVYAQNKRQQIVMMEMFAKQHGGIQFSSMHPGWADTPAVQNSMPDFYEKLKDKFRTSEQGADTVVWLAASNAATKQANGQFFFDRKAVSPHLPLAWTKSSDREKSEFMERLDSLSRQVTGAS
ncbi:dehydrogenase/reductase SDR family member 12-like [Ptychodera flava]|uniref:dehydrogenase/reductase SDR family member 12-like n=1 Tax=Ptychodera flava TaxID=63121 RepID=UPI00396A6936